MARDGYRVFDSDMHVLEPVDLWERYLDRPWRHRAPRGSTWKPTDVGVVVDGTNTFGLAAQIARVSFTEGLDRFAEDIARVEAGDPDQLHVDVMDGRFVPNLTIGPVVVEAIRKRTRLPLDCHLMIVEPERYVGDFVRAGADMVTVHVEATPHLQRVLAQIREAGAKAGAE